MSAKESGGAERWFRTQALAASFRARGERVYPGVLLAVRPCSFSMHSVADAALDPWTESPRGIALWGAIHEFGAGCVRVETGDEARPYAALVGGDMARPPTRIGRIDAWLIRADALRRLRAGTPSAFGGIAVGEMELRAAVKEIGRVVRESSLTLLKLAPPDARPSLPALAAVADAQTPDESTLSTAIVQILASIAAWQCLQTPPRMLSDAELADARRYLDSPPRRQDDELDIEFRRGLRLCVEHNERAHAETTATPSLAPAKPLLRGDLPLLRVQQSWHIVGSAVMTTRDGGVRDATPPLIWQAELHPLTERVRDWRAAARSMARGLDSAHTAKHMFLDHTRDLTKSLLGRFGILSEEDSGLIVPPCNYPQRFQLAILDLVACIRRVQDHLDTQAFEQFRLPVELGGVIESVATSFLETCEHRDGIGNGTRSRDEINDKPRPAQLEAPAASQASNDPFAHGDDFTWVRWNGVAHEFTKGIQSECVRALWDQWEKSGRQSGCGLGEKAIGMQAGSSSERFRIAHAFRGHKTWKTMIRTTRKGVFALFVPESPQNPPS